MRFAPLTAVDWQAFPGPPEYVPGDVPPALLALAAATAEQKAWDAYDRTLFAIGNNHAGTLYPAAVAAVLVLLTIAQQATASWPRSAALEVLIDVACSVAPEPGYEVFVGADDRAVRLMEDVRAAIRQAETELWRLAARYSDDQRLSDSIRALLDCLDG